MGNRRGPKPVEPASRLHAWRIGHDLSLGELSDLTGMDPTSIWRIEQGQRNPSIRTKVLLARRLGVRIGDLFEVPPLEEAAL